MTTTDPDLRLFAAFASLEDAGRTHDEAVLAILPNYLVWEATGWHSATRAAPCGGGDPPESAGFDSFDLDRDTTPAWAVEYFDGLSEEEQEKITTTAEEAEIDRRD